MTPSPRRLRVEVIIILGLSLGEAAVFAISEIVERYLSPKPIGQQTATLHPSASSLDVMDFINQLLLIGFRILPVALALFLLGGGAVRARDRLGLVWKRGMASAWGDLARGAMLTAAIGIPGLALYWAGRMLGQGVRINTSGLPDAWWIAVVLILSAAAAALLEETIAVGYLLTRLGELRWTVPAMVAASSILRGSYHLYQGWPMALGNVVMGVIFAAVYLRWRRLGPLIAAHFLLDLVSFIGPEVVPESWIDWLHVA